MSTPGPPHDHGDVPLARLRKVVLRRAVAAGVPRSDADDLAQAVTVSVDRHRPANPEAYAAGATRRAIALHWRRSRVPPTEPTDVSSETSEGCPLATLIAQENAALTIAALDALVLWNPLARAVVVEVDGHGIPERGAAEALVRFYLRLLRCMPVHERTRRRRAAALSARLGELRERTTRRAAPRGRRPGNEGSAHWRLARGLAFVGWVDGNLDPHHAVALVLTLETEATDSNTMESEERP